MNPKILLLVFTAVSVFAAEPTVPAPGKDAVPAPVTIFKLDPDALTKLPRGFTKVVGADQDILLLLDNAKLDHGELVTHFKTLNTDDEQAAGIVCRYLDPQNYFLIEANGKEESCSLYRIRKGKRKLLDSKPVIISPMTQHELHLVFANGTFTALIDGEAALGGKNSNFEGAGLVGLSAISGSAISFTDFRLSP